MPRKASPKSNQATLTEEQQERLFEACVPMGYYRAALWAEKEFGLQTSVASLSRWYSKRAQEMTKGRLREMLQGADEFDAQLDRKQVDAKIANALRTKFFEVIQGTEDVETVKAFGALVLNFVRNEQNDERLDVMRKRLEQTEEQLRIARADSQQLAVEGLLEEAKGNEEAKRLLNLFLAALKK
jgi:hypothetical protein